MPVVGNLEKKQGSKFKNKTIVQQEGCWKIYMRLGLLSYVLVWIFLEEEYASRSCEGVR